MFTFTTTDALHSLERFIERHGMARITGLDEALTAIDAAAQRAGVIMHNGQETHRLALALLDDDNPLDNPEVQRAVMAQAVGNTGVRPVVEAEVARRRELAVREHAPAVVAALDGLVTKAAKDVARAHTLMPEVNLGDPKPVTTTEAGHITAWAKARDGLDLIAEAGSVWAMLARTTHLAEVNDALLALTPATYEDMLALPERSLAGVANAGLPIKLATFEEYGERVDAHTEARDAKRREEEKKRFTHGRRNGFLGAA